MLLWISGMCIWWWVGECAACWP